MKKKHCTAAYTQNELGKGSGKGERQGAGDRPKQSARNETKPPPTAAAAAVTAAAASQNLNDKLTNRRTGQTDRRQLFM